MPLKFVTDHQEAITNLYTDVGLDAVVCYDLPHFPTGSLAAFYPADYLAKCVSVTVAISGDAHNDRDWMVICPYRIDETGARHDKVYDLDPFVVTLDSDTGLPSATGIVAYHCKFDDRSSPVSGYQHLTKEGTVTALRQHVVTGAKPLTAVPAPVLRALQHMSRVFVDKLS